MSVRSLARPSTRLALPPLSRSVPPVAVAAIALIAAQLALRAVLAWRGYFYWDDLVLVGRAGTHHLWSASYLLDDHDGHVMPGAYLLAGVLTRAWPLQWAAPAVSLIALQLLVSLALLRALWVILGWRPALLVPLAFGLLCPMALPAFAWWAAALNSLPMLAALAWVCADSILLMRTGSGRHAVTAVLAYAGGLAFFEKAAVIPVVAFIVTVLCRHVRAEPISAVWRVGSRMWAAMAAVTAAWLILYLVVVDQRRWGTDLGMTRALLWRSISRGIIPALVGGPWQWARWAPASPWATPTAAVTILGWITLAAALGLALARKQRTAWVWAAAGGYAVGCQVPIYLMRSSAFTVLELAQTLRYLSDLVVALSLLGAVVLHAPDRAGVASPTRRTRLVVSVAATVAFAISSLYSTGTFLTSWRDNPAEGYLRNALDSLAEAHRESGTPLLDQEVDPMVLQRVVWPENLASHLFALVRDRPAFAPGTPRLRMFDRAGHLVDARVTWVRTIVPGPAGDCGYLVQPDHPAQMNLDGPLLPADWTAELGYLANMHGAITLALDEGMTARVRVRPGLNRIYVRLSGAGSTITARADTEALSVCIAAGPVGHLAQW